MTSRKIVFKNVSFSYDSIKILDDMNLEIKGDFIGIFGETGSVNLLF